MDFVPLLFIGALIVLMLVMSNRSKAKRLAADVERRKAMVPGTRVMTTSGLHGTVTAVDPANDGSQADTVTLEIAPGTEVTWALIALREVPVRAAVEAGPAAEQVTGSTEGPVRMVKPKGRSAES